MARRSEEQKRSAQFPALLDELGKRVPEELITWISGETQRWYGRIIWHPKGRGVYRNSAACPSSITSVKSLTWFRYFASLRFAKLNRRPLYTISAGRCVAGDVFSVTRSELCYTVCALGVPLASERMYRDQAV